MKRLAFLVLSLVLADCYAQQRIPEQVDISPEDFTKNVVTQVLFHELGHALIHELDIPVLANEEAMADAFSNYYLIRYRRDDAVDIITSRAISWLIEDSEVSPDNYDMKGEHDLDIRRAYQSLCQVYGADPAEWGAYFEWVGFSEGDLSSCSETSPNIEAGWDKLIQPNRRGAHEQSDQVSVIYGEGYLADRMRSYGVLEFLEQEMERFSWSKPVIIHFDHCDKGAYWSSRERKIMLYDDYVQRFIDQSDRLNNESEQRL